jgi:hypothetical protein
MFSTLSAVSNRTSQCYDNSEGCDHSSPCETQNGSHLSKALEQENNKRAR